jgi:DNA-binding MarR family transcriptional regulator
LYHKQFGRRRILPVRFDQPPPEPLASAVGFLLAWNGQRIARVFAAKLEPLGLRPPHFGVMNLIESRPGISQHDLVTGAMIDPSSMVKVIDELESLGLAERRVDPNDRRKRAVHLTPAGSEMLGRARKVAMATADDVLGPLTPDERETLRRLLRKMAGLEV